MRERIIFIKESFMRHKSQTLAKVDYHELYETPMLVNFYSYSGNMPTLENTVHEQIHNVNRTSKAAVKREILQLDAYAIGLFHKQLDKLDLLYTLTENEKIDTAICKKHAYYKLSYVFSQVMDFPHYSKKQILCDDDLSIKLSNAFPSPDITSNMSLDDWFHIIMNHSNFNYSDKYEDLIKTLNIYIPKLSIFSIIPMRNYTSKRRYMWRNSLDLINKKIWFREYML